LTTRPIAERSGAKFYLKEGVGLGSRPELVGGGLIRSLGGLQAVTKMSIDGQERLKGDQRILGDSGFVVDVLKQADENFERYYEMKRLGYDLNTIEDRVGEIYKIEKEDIFSRSRQKVKSDARALFCFWAVRELGYGQRELARRLGMTQPGVGHAVIKGEAISKSNNYQIKN
jgi:putative transposase